MTFLTKSNLLIFKPNNPRKLKFQSEKVNHMELSSIFEVLSIQKTKEISLYDLDYTYNPKCLSVFLERLSQFFIHRNNKITKKNSLFGIETPNRLMDSTSSILCKR